MNKRVELAKGKREAARAEHLARLEALVKRRTGADKKRAVRLAKPSAIEARALLFATKRAALDLRLLQRGEAAGKKVEAAAARRGQRLSAVVAKAKMTSVLRATSVKFTLSAQDGSDLPVVQVTFVLPGEQPTGIDKRTLAVEEKQEAKQGDVAKDTTGHKGVATSGAVLSRIRNLLPF